MHLIREEVTKKIPIKRKGTKYVARAASHVTNSVPVVIAVRDMLHFARTSAEVKHMIHTKLLKINGRLVRDLNESIKLFNIFEADKQYVLKLLPTGRFTFVETKDSKRVCKVISKRLLPKSKIQLNLHDGSNVIGKKDISVGDSIYLDFSSKILSHKILEKGAKVFIISGKYTGSEGSISEISGKNVTVKLEGGSANLLQDAVLVLWI